ncbi:MAG: PrsW family glutamic-type intramembrane protease [Acidimicrobiales bacterium]
MDLIVASEAFLVSFVLVFPFVVALRPRLLSFMAGATLVALGALVVEFLVQSALNPLYGVAIVLVLVAPPVEELLKFVASGLTGANFASAAGAGIGFAASENALYFLAAWGEPTASLVALIAIRAFTDPLLHSTATTLTTMSWHGRPWGLPAGIALHMAWNTLALVEISIDPTIGLALLGVGSIAILGILWLLRRNPDVHETLADDWRMNPWTGNLSEVTGG